MSLLLRICTMISRAMVMELRCCRTDASFGARERNDGHVGIPSLHINIFMVNFPLYEGQGLFHVAS